MTAPSIQMNDGNAMPAIALGTGMVDGDTCATWIPQATELGWRHIDTAASYGNEEGVGKGLRDSGVDRSELYVTTKVPSEGHGYDEAQRALDQSLQRMGLDYVDLYLIHWPLPQKNKYADAWRGLIELQKNGKARSIGVSNFLPKHTRRLIDETGVTPAANQIQLFPGLSRDDLRTYNDEQGIVTECWSPLSLGATTLYFGGDGSAMRDPEIKDIAETYGRTSAQIILRWHTQLGMVPVTRSSKPERLRQSIENFDFMLTEAELARISAVKDGSVRPEDPETHSE